MLKSEMQHQFWVTKKAVQRKLGGKEDQFVVSSDSELDSKIELFKSVTESINLLFRIIDQYQDRLCILSQDENNLGKFLKEAGKNSNNVGKIISSTGKTISYSGQQRMNIRAPLLRLYHEVETFRSRAISDTQTTITAMERQRTEYRAALSWMKSVSAQLDPDTGRNVDKFRKAQNHVKISKMKFDKLALDCLQKIDLLAAARCNMFSHVLVAYQSSLQKFAVKTNETFHQTIKSLTSEPQYNFNILKELTQTNNKPEAEDVKPIDSDQLLFFQDEYKDETAQATEKPLEKSSSKEETALIDITEHVNNNEVEKKNEATKEELPKGDCKKDSGNLLEIFDTDMVFDEDSSLFTPSQLLLQNMNLFQLDNELVNEKSSKDKDKVPSFFDKFTRVQGSGDKATESNKPSQINNIPSKSNKDKLAWFDLFAELDPLSNNAEMNALNSAVNSHAA